MFPNSPEEFSNLTKGANLIPVFQEYSAALDTPLSVFLKLNKGPYAFLLESVEKGTQMGRYSFIGFEPAVIFQAKDGKVSITNKEKTIMYESTDPLQELEKIFKNYQPLKVPGLPGFSGGAVGYLGYDMIRYWEKLPKDPCKDTGYPDCFFMFPETLIIFDHVKQTIMIVVNVSVGEDPERNYLQAVNTIKEIIMKLKKPIYQVPEEKPQYIEKYTDYIYNCTPGEFQEMVKSAKEYIRAGDIFQVVLSRKVGFLLKTEPLLIYRNLRSLNPSPYMFYLSFADIKLIGSSPEVMVKVEDGRAELRPIAGTRPRGQTPEEDLRFSAELLRDEKERAEHLMLVDLGRNDLGRISQYGSVEVEDFMNIENYSHVKHIVSRVTGRLKGEYNCFDVLRASFPAGTVSGAPKIRAMEIIDQLEPDGRGPYAGAVGYISYTGNMDTCITIRTLIARGNRGFVQAGAGIVADSDPFREYQEVCNKAAALLRAVEMAERGEFFAASN
ncbi:MAG: anthranilate synthase component [Clostridia bacterium]|nr:anthranilate synthase component [Clostridia bacterium]